LDLDVLTLLWVEEAKLAAQVFKTNEVALA
jgi:hypothetical protein